MAFTDYESINPFDFILKQITTPWILGVLIVFTISYLAFASGHRIINKYETKHKKAKIGFFKHTRILIGFLVPIYIFTSFVSYTAASMDNQREWKKLREQEELEYVKSLPIQSYTLLSMVNLGPKSILSSYHTEGKNLANQCTTHNYKVEYLKDKLSSSAIFNACVSYEEKYDNYTIEYKYLDEELEYWSPGYFDVMIYYPKDYNKNKEES